MVSKTAIEGEKCASCRSTMNVGARTCKDCGARRIIVPVRWAQVLM